VPDITEAPATLTYDTSAHFEFSDQGQHGGFQCRLDNAAFGPCGPASISYLGLGLGRHCFYVLAVRGNYRSAPRGFCWQCQPIRVRGGFSIGGDAANAFYPGASEPLDLAITNPFKFAIKVLTVSVTVEPVPDKDGVPDPACPATANLLVTRPLGTTVTVPAGSSKSLSDLGVPSAEWPVLTMPDLPTNQDACEGATFTLLYSGTATMGTPRPVQTWTLLVAFPNPSALGHAVTLTAIVAKSLGPGTPAGSVSFYSGIPNGPHVLLGISSLNGGKRAIWTTSGLAAGSVGLYAVYAGGTNFAPSTSPVIFELVIAPRASHGGIFESSQAAYDHDTFIGRTGLVAS
jgi:Bacterial Ig-like domain (group 3)